MTFLSGEYTAETPSRCPSRCLTWDPRRWREFGTGGPPRPGLLIRYRAAGMEEGPRGPWSWAHESADRVRSPRPDWWCAGSRERPRTGRSLPEAGGTLMNAPVQNYPNSRRAALRGPAPSPPNRWPSPPQRYPPSSMRAKQPRTVWPAVRSVRFFCSFCFSLLGGKWRRAGREKWLLHILPFPSTELNYNTLCQKQHWF